MLCCFQENSFACYPLLSVAFIFMMSLILFRLFGRLYPVLSGQMPSYHLGCLFLFDRNLFWGLKNSKKTGFLSISFFPVFSGGIFHRNVVLEGVAGIPVFFLQILQEFFAGIPVGRNSCIYPGILQGIPEDSEGFLFPPKAVGSGQRLKKALC